MQKRPLCGKAACLFFYFYDPFAILIKCIFPEKKRKKNENYEKILLCCWASLGDVFLASFMIQSIKERWPNSQIGFLCSPQSVSVLDSVQGIDHVHAVPSWLDCHKNKIRNLLSLFYHNLFIYPKMIADLKKMNYDVSLELHPFFPNSIPLMRRARIPRRIGLEGSGYEMWLTDAVSLASSAHYLPHLFEPFLLLLDAKKIEAIKKTRDSFASKRVVLHMGTSDERKEWPISYWKLIAETLEEKGYSIVFTGKGKREKKMIEKALSKTAISLCDTLDFKELFQVISEARLLVSVDSVPVHIAARCQVPFVALYLYNTGVEFWLPDAENCHLFISEKCVRRFKNESHLKATYKEEIGPSDVLCKVNKLLGDPL